MKSKITYHVEITRFLPGPDTARLIFQYSSDVLSALPLKDNAELVITVAALTGEIDYGNFLVFLNKSGRAWARLLEHRDINPRDPVAVNTSNEPVYFRDEEGEEFSVRHSETVTREKALAALEYWLPEQKRDPSLVWE